MEQPEYHAIQKLNNSSGIKRAQKTCPSLQLSIFIGLVGSLMSPVSLAQQANSNVARTQNIPTTDDARENNQKSTQLTDDEKAWQQLLSTIKTSNTQHSHDPKNIEQALNKMVNLSDLNITNNIPVAKLDGSSETIGLDRSLLNKSISTTRQLVEQSYQDVELVTQSKTASIASVETNKQTTHPNQKPKIGNMKTENNFNKNLENIESGKNNINTRPVSKINQLNHHFTTERLKLYDGTSPLNPDDYLPEYQSKDDTSNTPESPHQAPEKTQSQPSFFSKVKAKLFHDGLVPLPKIKTNIYKQSADKEVKLTASELNQQPYKNIKASLEEIYTDTITDFTAALPTLRKTAKNAAEAVGYYDVNISFRHNHNHNQIPTTINPYSETIDVIIQSIGEPVVVENRVIDIRGEGSQLTSFQNIEQNALPLEGQIFNQQDYKATKSMIASKSGQLGFFDSEWLNNSADVILPDNTVDVDLVYDTGERYKFGDVVFFTIDEESGKLTSNPDKLPVKLELLQKMLSFNYGDAYQRHKVSELRNDLSTTRYFNSVNVEEVLPIESLEGEGGDEVDLINFERLAKNDNLIDDTTPSIVSTSPNHAPLSNKINEDNQNNSKPPVDIALIAFHGLSTDDSFNIENLNLHDIQGLTGKSNATKNNQKSTANAIVDNLINSTISEQTANQQLASITFSIDDSTSDKYNAIEQKANNLLIMPDDRVLNEQVQKNQTPLGKVSDAISSVAKAILPDENEIQPTLSLDRPELEQKITPKQVKANKKVPMYILVMSNKPYDAQVGVGWGTDTGFRTTAKLDNNLINRDGYRAGVSAEWSKTNKKVGIHASRPWKHPLDDTLSSSVSYEEEILNQGNNNDWRTKSLQASIARNIYKEGGSIDIKDKNGFSINNDISKGGWNRSYSLRYRYDELELGDDLNANPDDLPVRFNNSNPKQKALLLGYSMHKTKADNLTNPKFGYRQQYSLEAGLNNAGTDTDMIITRAGVTGIYSFGDNYQHQVIGKLNTGYMWANDFYDVPYSLRFFAGGDQSIRGYDYKSLSPLDNGYLTGGQILGVGSAEYNYEFKKGLRGAVFTDVGNAYDIDFTTPTKVGVGFGIRWASPVGPVRLDVGAGVTEESIPIRLHLFIGSPL